MGTKLGKVLYRNEDADIFIDVNDADMLVITDSNKTLLYLAELKYMRRD